MGDSVNSSFQAFDGYEVKFSRQSELKTVLTLIITLLGQIIPDQRDNFLLFSRGCLGCLSVFQGYIKQSKFYIHPHVWLSFGIAECVFVLSIKKIAFVNFIKFC